MSSLSDLPRAPAHRGAVPGLPVYGPVADAAVAALLSSIPGAQRIEQLQPEFGPARFFRALRRSAPPLFLKVVDAGAYQAIAESEALLQSLPSDAGAVRSCGVHRLGARVAVAYPYIDARYLAPSESDMRLLGRAIARLHGGLGSLPDRAGVRARAAARARRLAAALGAESNRPPLDALGISAAMAPMRFEFEGADAQPLHGDLNAGNILGEKETALIHFLDFEDLRHSFGPPILDLALPVERFCLLLDDEARAIASAAALLRSYGDAAGAPALRRPGELAEMLRLVNLRAIALLLERRAAGLETADEEWRKFATLLQRHEERRHVIAAIEDSAL